MNNSKPRAHSIPPESLKITFCWGRKVVFYETDAMGVVHHSNYLRYFEECRLAWLEATGLDAEHAPAADLVMAVLDCGVKFLRPLRLAEVFVITLRVERVGQSQLRFDYELRSEAEPQTLIACGWTQHVAVNKELRPLRLPKKWRDHLNTALG